MLIIYNWSFFSYSTTADWKSVLVTTTNIRPSPISEEISENP